MIKWSVSPEVLSSMIDDEVVLMSIKEGYYFSLEPVGSRIWNLLSEHPATVEELIYRLMIEYDIDRDTCLKDVQVFIDEMTSKNLILKLEE